MHHRKRIVQYTTFLPEQSKEETETQTLKRGVAFHCKAIHQWKIQHCTRKKLSDGQTKDRYYLFFFTQFITTATANTSQTQWLHIGKRKFYYFTVRNFHQSTVRRKNSNIWHTTTRYSVHVPVKHCLLTNDET